MRGSSSGAREGIRQSRLPKPTVYGTREHRHRLFCPRVGGLDGGKAAAPRSKRLSPPANQLTLTSAAYPRQLLTSPGSWHGWTALPGSSSDISGYCQLGAEEAKLPRAQPSREYTSAHEGNTSRIAPGEEGAITSSSVLTGGETMTAELEVIVDPSVGGEELLCMPG
jgi:hypothetical protein